MIEERVSRIEKTLERLQEILMKYEDVDGENPFLKKLVDLSFDLDFAHEQTRLDSIPPLILHYKTLRALTAAGYIFLEELKGMNYAELIKIKGIGEMGVYAIHQALKQYGIVD